MDAMNKSKKGGAIQTRSRPFSLIDELHAAETAEKLPNKLNFHLGGSLEERWS